VIYIDDVIIFAETIEEFRKVIQEVVTRLASKRVSLKRSKCVIWAEELKILGHVVGPTSMRMADSRIEEVLRISFPRNPKELRSALGQLNFQRGYIPNYAAFAAPLTGFVNGTTAAMQTAEARAAWTTLMEAVANQCQLHFLSYDEQIVLRVDASVLGVGAALFNVSLHAGERQERLVAVASHGFTRVERQWKTIEQECFAVVYGCRYFYGLLWGQVFVVDGDHKNLAYIHKGSSPKIVRWNMFLPLCTDR
jgi:hypothetical protein